MFIYSTVLKRLKRETKSKVATNLQRDLGIDAEGEVVVDDIERQVVLAAFIRWRTIQIPVNLQHPTIHLKNRHLKSHKEKMADAKSTPA